MKNALLLFLVVLLPVLLFAQQKIPWDSTYELQLSDFQSPATQIGHTSVNSLSGPSEMDFSFGMSNYEFMFTKNFNSKVSCSFSRDQATLVAVDSATARRLLAVARYRFDLSELYARKFRQKLYEEKGVFSDVRFFRPVFDTICKAFTRRSTMAEKETGMGQDTVRLAALRHQVREEIQALPGFCKTCKPPKKKKHRKKRQ